MAGRATNSVNIGRCFLNVVPLGELPVMKQLLEFHILGRTLSLLRER
jgi:hypothetical protein